MREAKNLLNTRHERNLTGRTETRQMIRSMAEGATIIPTAISLNRQDELLWRQNTQSSSNRPKLQPKRRKREKSKKKLQGREPTKS